VRVGTLSYRKDLTPHAFHTIWKQAEIRLQSARKWLFIGYSLPEADIEIRHLLKSAQLARKEPSALSIEVVLKEDCVAGERYNRFFGAAAGQVFHSGIEKCVSERLSDYCR